MGEEAKAEAKARKKFKVNQDVVKAVSVASLVTGLPEDQLLKNALAAYVDNMFIMEQLGNVSATQALAAAKFAYNIYETFARMVAHEMEMRMMALNYYTRLFDIISEANKKIEEIKTGHLLETQQQQSQVEFLSQKIYDLEKMLEQKVEELKSSKRDEEIEKELSLSDFIDVDAVKDVVRPVVTNIIANVVKYGSFKLQSLLK